jgi:hypothetical protein
MTLQNSDIQGALMNLNSSLNALSGNMSATADGVEVEDEESGEGEAE